jgi:hypothetical protein
MVDMVLSSDSCCLLNQQQAADAAEMIVVSSQRQAVLHGAGGNPQIIGGYGAATVATQNSSAKEMLFDPLLGKHLACLTKKKLSTDTASSTSNCLDWRRSFPHLNRYSQIITFWQFL